MAISTNYAFGVAVKQMQDVQAQIAKTQGQLATGTKLGNPSDNPDANASVQRLQSAISRQTSYSKSLTQADNRLAAQETNISGSSGVLIRIKELTLQAANATVSSSGRVNSSTEIKSLRDQLLAMANARDESGNFIFGGARTGSQPFAANAQGQINYTGDQSQVEVAIGDQSRVAVGGVGSQVFTSVVRDVNGTKTGVGFFQALAERYKLTQRMAPGGYVDFAFTDYANLWNNPQPFIDEFMRVAKPLVACGATSLYPAGLYLSQWLIDQGIREVDGAIIMDPLAIAIKMAELRHQLAPIGIKRYQAGAWAVPPDEVRKILANEFDAK